MPYYSVATGHQVGVFQTWAECSAAVKGYKGAKYKKFDTRLEAEEYLVTGSVTETVEAVAAVLAKPFRIGQLFKDIVNIGVVLPANEIDKNNLLNKIIDSSTQYFAGQFNQNGFWAG